VRELRQRYDRLYGTALVGERDMAKRRANNPMGL